MSAIVATKESPSAVKNSMKIVIERSHLLKALAHVQSVVERRGTIAVLSNVKIDAQDDTVSFSATDMDIAIVESVPGNVARNGLTTVPAHMLYEIVRKLPEGAQVEITESDDNSRVSVRAGQSRFSLACLPVEEFPVMAEGDLEYNFSLKVPECKAIIEKPSFAMSNEETRYYLNGIYLHVIGSGAGKALRAVATDGHRLSRVEVAMPPGADGMPGVIVPRKAIYELRKLLAEYQGEVAISLSESKIRFALGSATIVSKLIDGNFPDYERVIPNANDKILEVDRKSFADAVDRVSVISSDKTRAVKLHAESGKLTLSASSSEHGMASEEIESTYSAQTLEMGFNSRYMLEMLANIEGDTVQFLLNDSASPALVRDPADVSALYVIMPMRV